MVLLQRQLWKPLKDNSMSQKGQFNEPEGSHRPRVIYGITTMDAGKRKEA